MTRGAPGIKDALKNAARLSSATVEEEGRAGVGTSVGGFGAGGGVRGDDGGIASVKGIGTWDTTASGA